MSFSRHLILGIGLAAAIAVAAGRLSADPADSPAEKWRDQAVAKWEAVIQQARDKDLALLESLKDREPTPEMNAQRKELATQRTTARRQVASLKNLKGATLEKAFQAELRAEAERKEREAAEKRNSQTVKAEQKRNAANLRQARLLFGNDVELTACDQCPAARYNGGCGKCGNTGFMPVR